MVVPQGHSGQGTAAGTAHTRQWTCCHKALSATVPVPEVLILSLMAPSLV